MSAETCQGSGLDALRARVDQARELLETALARSEGARQSLFSASTIGWKVDEARARWYQAEAQVYERHAALCQAQAMLAAAEEVRR